MHTVIARKEAGGGSHINSCGNYESALTFVNWLASQIWSPLGGKLHYVNCEY